MKEDEDTPYEGLNQCSSAFSVMVHPKDV